ncbi:MAG: CapA family protein [Romboutsia sp.]|nr:CapA family protein [Romboutsia sp.]
MEKKYNQKKLILVVAILGIVLYLLLEPTLKSSKNDNNELLSNKENIENEIDKPVEKKSITISFAGDVTMGNYKGSSYYGTFDNEFQNRNGNFDYFFENVKDIFINDDLSIVNLEGPLTTAQNAKVKKFAFKGDPSYVNILKSGNIEAVSIANNHSEDYFEEGIEDTKFILEQNDIKYFGLGEQSIIDTNGIKVGLLGYNGWTENYTEENLNNMKNDIEALKKDADIVAVYFHWGVERSYTPNQIQKDFAHNAIDYGSDLVIGAHPHVLQGIEEYKGKYIAYSLGNFCFGGNKNPSDKDSMIYQQTFSFENNELIGIEVPNIIPCSISSTNSRNDYKPTILQGSESERVLNKIKSISESLN